jgi:hypothetical protein
MSVSSGSAASARRRARPSARKRRQGHGEWAREDDEVARDACIAPLEVSTISNNDAPPPLPHPSHQGSARACAREENPSENEPQSWQSRGSQSSTSHRSGESLKGTCLCRLQGTFRRSLEKIIIHLLFFVYVVFVV